MKSIGICGGICSGKSTLTLYIASKIDGSEIVDCDKLGHKVYELNIDGILEEMELEFGSEIISIENGTKKVNRQVLGPIVFGNKEKLDTLSQLVWPKIRKLIIEKKKSSSHTLLFEASVLVEAGWADLFDQVWCFSVPRDEAIERLMVRNNLTREDATKRVTSQITNEQRQLGANHVIYTSGSIDDAKQQLDKIIQL